MDNERKPNKSAFIKKIKDFHSKPMSDMTVGDMLIMHGEGVVLATLVGMTISGWVEILRRTRIK